MITLRTLKKRSRLARDLLVDHYGLDPDTIFPAERGENYHGLVIRCTHGAGDPCRTPGRPRCDCTSHPLKGTLMTGGMSGYETPEWDEETLLETLTDYVSWGERPATMSDREWRLTLSITRVKPFNEEEFTRWMRECDAEDARSRNDQGSVRADGRDPGEDHADAA